MERENKFYKEDIVKYLRSEMGLTADKATNAVNLVFEFIWDSIKDGNDVVITGFGKFSRRSTKGREIKFGETKKFNVPDHYAMTFKSSKWVKKSLKGMEVK